MMPDINIRHISSRNEVKKIFLDLLLNKIIKSLKIIISTLLSAGIAYADKTYLKKLFKVILLSKKIKKLVKHLINTRRLLVSKGMY